MRRWHAVKVGLGVLIMALAYLPATPARAQLTQRCNWGVGALTPTVWPASTQVMMTPVVMDFGGAPLGTSKVAFISFENASQINRDGGGVLRIIDLNCREIARFPEPLFIGFVPPGCPANIFSHRLAPASGLAVGNIDTNPDVEIIAVLDAPTSNHAQIVAFNLGGGHLNPKWCSSPLPTGDFIHGPSAPAIAQLDGSNSSSAGQSEIIIDNKVFDANGILRYTGFNVGGPRSRTVVVSNVLGSTFLPQVITGRGVYQSSLNTSGAAWTGMLGWQNSNVGSTPLVYPAIADLDLSSGPHIVVTDTMAMTLRVLSPAGTQLASILLPVSGCPGLSCPCPGPQCPRCGGSPMIGDADPTQPGPEIGVATCNRYTLYRYSAGTLSQLWSRATNDPGGQTTSTLYNTKTGARIYYADATTLWVFNGASGAVLQQVPNTSNTAIEGPAIAAFDTGAGPGAVIVAANNYHLTSGGTRGVRIFDDPAIGPARSYWNQHTYHGTNVTNSFGAIPVVEPRSWVTPARNTFRVQQWP